MMVKSHVEGAKDSNINRGNIEENGKEKEKLVVKSKMNPAKNTLMVESHAK